MNTLNWEKLPTFKAQKPLWAQGGTTSSLQTMLNGAKLELDMAEFEEMVGEYDTNTNWILDAMFIYENGGGGLCSPARGTNWPRTVRARNPSTG